MSPDPRPLTDDLRRLAAAHGVATAYRNERREPVEVDAEVVIRVLGLLEVDAATEVARRAALAQFAERSRDGRVPPTIKHDRPPDTTSSERLKSSSMG